jgi:hypothetical protein
MNYRNHKKEIFISITAGIHSNGIAEQGFEIEVTPEQLVEYREIIGLETVIKILSLYYGLKEPKHPIARSTDSKALMETN